MWQYIVWYGMVWYGYVTVYSIVQYTVGEPYYHQPHSKSWIYSLFQCLEIGLSPNLQSWSPSSLSSSSSSLSSWNYNLCQGLEIWFCPNLELTSDKGSPKLHHQATEARFHKQTTKLTIISREPMKPWKWSHFRSLKVTKLSKRPIRWPENSGLIIRLRLACDRPVYQSVRAS